MYSVGYSSVHTHVLLQKRLIINIMNQSLEYYEDLEHFRQIWQKKKKEYNSAHGLQV